MLFPRHRRKLALAGLGAVLVLLLGTPPAAAQCAMCGQAAANASDDPEVASTTFEHAILVLLIPALGLLTATGVLLWKFRDAPCDAFPSLPHPDRIRPTQPSQRASITRLRSLKRSR